ncbi:peptidylprolyl isomerase [Williamwhitmania taraxaci]|uniref:peptidylprolyl isomerase n=1 Tax=Williamwhitmania taraxaci TaxID=1640674 RepID=A0A1G6GXH4_9BACT|nr:peptidylprolyl isomerase [Williamwhitmania taraxaci]SDB86712.1 peptidyl-prolyl cis-trans isomerase B (cyclophilin B) [Williamwhitmania taraxaci]
MPKIFSKGIILLSLLTAFSAGCSKKEGNKVLIKTSEGDILIELFSDTPKHKANFLKLANDGYYEDILFHRVIQGFMIQAGDPDSRKAEEGKMLGEGDPGYTIDAEFRPNHIHQKGALAAARTSDEENPEKKSSGSQFYIVQGKKFTEEELDKVEIKANTTRKTNLYSAILQEKLNLLGDKYNQNNFQKVMQQVKDSVDNVLMPQEKCIIPKNNRKIYKEVGGVPHLDGNYTVFGQVLEGFDVIDKIAAKETDSNDRPKKDVKIITIKVL